MNIHNHTGFQQLKLLRFLMQYVSLRILSEERSLNGAIRPS